MCVCVCVCVCVYVCVRSFVCLCMLTVFICFYIKKRFRHAVLDRDFPFITNSQKSKADIFLIYLVVIFPAKYIFI